MADYSSADDSLATKGLLLALVLLGLFVLILAFLGGGNETPGAIGGNVEAAGELTPAVDLAPQTGTQPEN
ncbi:MAG: hypothetical protein HKP40_08390 [Litoreibacter sp.]|nr:hypothetical protein [Litoreibacter sp.]